MVSSADIWFLRHIDIQVQFIDALHQNLKPRDFFY